MDRTRLTNSAVEQLNGDGKRKRLWDTQIPGFYAVVTPTGHKSFYYRYRWQSRTRDYKLGTYGAITANQARKLAMTASGDVARGVDIQEERKTARIEQRRKRASTLRIFVETVYAPYVMAERKSGDAVLARMSSCFGHWYNLPMPEITEWKVKRWRQEQLKRGLKPSTANRAIAYLRACLNYAYRMQVIESHPLQHLRPLKVDRLGIVRYLSPDEERRLRSALRQRELDLRAARQRYNDWLVARKRRPVAIPPELGYFDHLQPLILLAMNTGFRKGELLGLEWKHFDTHARTISVPGSKTKNKHSRHIPLNKEAFDVLTKWRHQNPTADFIFENASTGAPITDIKNGWGRVKELADVQNFRFHDLRHHFASSLAMAGIDLNTIRDLLGHSDLQMTLRYAHLAPSHHAAAVAVLDNRTT